MVVVVGDGGGYNNRMIALGDSERCPRIPVMIKLSAALLNSHLFGLNAVFQKPIWTEKSKDHRCLNYI